MEHIVKEAFIDSKDGRHYYRAGQVFPRKGTKSTEARIKELIKANVISGHPPEDISKLKKNELIQKAEEAGIELTGKETKDDIIASLKE